MNTSILLLRTSSNPQMIFCLELMWVEGGAFSVFLNSLVNSCADNVIHLESHDHLLRRELADDLRVLGLALLDLNELVAVASDGGLHLAAVRSLLVELLAQLEGDHGVLEGGRGLESVGASALRQLDDRRHGAAHFAGHEAHAHFLHVLIEVLAGV